MKMFDFTGSEKAMAALTPATVPLVTIITALLALAGLGVMPSAEILAQAIAFLIMTLFGSRLTWQVPNTGFKKEEKEVVEEELPAVDE